MNQTQKLSFLFFYNSEIKKVGLDIMKSIQLPGGHVSTIEAMERNFGLFQFPGTPECAQNVFLIRSELQFPVLFSSGLEMSNLCLNGKLPCNISINPIKIKKLTNKQVFTYCRAR